MSGDDERRTGDGTAAPADAVLRTRRLVLDAPRRADAFALVEALADIAVAGRLARVPHPYGLADAYAFLAGCELARLAGTAWTFAVRPAPAAAWAGEPAAPRPCPGSAGGGAAPLFGLVGLQGLPEDPELGYWIARPAWGRGLATEAAAAVLDFGFRRLGLAAIRSGVFAGNDASLAVQRKLGFAVTGRSPVFCLAQRKMLDHIDTRLERPATNAG